MKISLLAMLKHCPNCNRTCWLHFRGKQLVCRGDIAPKHMHEYDAAVARGIKPGCQRVIEKK